LAEPAVRVAFPRVLFLGASNVQRLLPELVRAARERLGAPLDVLASHGRGRSYIGPSRFIGRGLPVVAPPALWAALERGPAPAAALLADAGNDLAYGASAARTGEAIAALVTRLAERGTRVSLAGLPLAVLEATGPVRFALARTLFFPTRRIERAAVLAEARALDERLRALGGERGCAYVALDPSWYGVDPIHVRFARRAEAARAFVAPFALAAAAEPGPAPGGPVRALRVQPAESSWLGWRRSCPQPSGRLPDGTSLSWY
jgi:hypothetical protein